MLIRFLLSFGTMISVIAALENTEKANLFVDQLLDAIKNDPELQIDPYPLEDKVLGFEQKVLVVTLKGEAKLHKGMITGLTSVHRTGDTTMTYNNKGQVKIRSKVSMGVLNAKTTANVHFMNFGPSVTFKARIGFAEIDLGLSANPKTDRYATVTDFKLLGLKGLEVKVEGLGPLNFIFNIMTGLAVNFFNFAVKLTTEKIMADLARKEIRKIPLPEFSIN